jgi:hypothetical protein
MSVLSSFSTVQVIDAAEMTRDAFPRRNGGMIYQRERERG